MKFGADDYLMKERTVRLGLAIRRVLEEKRLRGEPNRAEQQNLIQAQALEAAANAIVITDRQGKILSVNQAFTTLTGYTREETLGQYPRLLKSGEHEAGFYRQLWETVVSGKVWQGEITNRRKDGTLCDEEMTITPIRAHGGEITHFIAVKQDVTERKRAEEMRHESDELNRGVLNSMGAHIAVLDRDGKIISVNDAWQQFAEGNSNQSQAVPARTVIGTNYLEVCRNSRGTFSAEAMLAHDGLQAVLRKEKKNFTLEYPCHSPKVKRWFILSATPLKTKNGGAVVAHIDITERRQLEEQFRQSQKMEGIGQLAGGVAHDFNNILATIQMQASLLKCDEILSPEQDELADEIGEAVQRAAALTRQLLLFSRKEIMREADLDLNQSIQSILKMLRRTIGEDIQTQLKLAAQPMLLHADPGMMDQVLLNLAVNARDAMPKGGQLVIETSGVEFDEQAASHSANIRPGPFVCLSVSDSGCGISPENISRIFEPFFTTKEVGKGTGLGLATVFGIVQQHRGWINVSSEVGQGTTFRIYLPRQAELSGKKSSETTFTSLPGGKETILLVEDDSALRAIVHTSLSRLGYQVLDAADGIKALDVWKAHRNEIRLVLTDMVMPGGMNGIELGAQLLKENPQLKVIYASGYSAEVAGKDFPLQEGVNFLTKPFQRSKLAQVVRAMLDA